MISFQEASAIISQHSVSFGDEELLLDDALGRVLAEDVYAFRDFPPFNRSAMDGIAVNFKDIEIGITEFKLKEIIFAGSANKFSLQSGECYKIMTGAAVPDDADLVIRIEDVELGIDSFKIRKSDLILGQNIANKGQDLRKGALAIEKGCLLNPPTIGLLASLGKAKVLVTCLPKVNIITTGNEVVGLDKLPSDLHIYNSNAYALKALLRENLIKVNHCCHVDDDEKTLAKEISNALDGDILILTGGVSAGDADYIPGVLKNLGAEKLFHKVAIKPGKPVWCGKLDKTMIFALPGNPFSALVTFKLFTEAHIKKCIGRKETQFSKLPVDFQRKKSSSFDEFFPVIKDGSLLKKVGINGSGDVRLGNQANGLALQKASHDHLFVGELLDFLAW